jgi:Ran GTPase-activating protein (RanGAP) involved in mRNA processing and transport
MHNDGLSLLSTALETNSSLTSLRLQRCRVDGKGMPGLASALARSGQLTELDLSGNALGDGAAALCELLEQSSALCTLRLRGCSVGDVGGLSLATSFTLCPSLRVFDVSFNLIGKRVVMELAIKLASNETVQEVVVGGNEVSLEEFKRASGPRLAQLVERPHPRLRLVE